MKPGYLTTEFWLTILAQVLPFLVMFKIVPAEDSTNIQAMVSTLIMGIGSLVVSVTAIVTYIKGRVATKAEAEKTKCEILRTEQKRIELEIAKVPIE